MNNKSVRNLMLISILFLDIAIAANHFGGILGEIFREGWNGEFVFGVFFTSASLFFFIIPFISIPLVAVAWILGFLFKPVEPIYIISSRNISLCSGIIAVIFLVSGIFVGTFAWPWQLAEKILFPIFF